MPGFYGWNADFSQSIHKLGPFHGWDAKNDASEEVPLPQTQSELLTMPQSAPRSVRWPCNLPVSKPIIQPKAVYNPTKLLTIQPKAACNPTKLVPIQPSSMWFIQSCLQSNG